MSTELSKPNKVVIGGQKFGLAKKIAESKTNGNVDFNSFPNRLGLVLDDSGSMSGSMPQVHLAVETFIKNCNSNDTALCLYPLNAQQMSLTNNFASVGIFAATLEATGGTPLYTKLQLMLEKENITRAVAFSDGSPTDNSTVYGEDTNNSNKHEATMKLYQAKKVPIDTIYIGYSDSSGYRTMKRIADETGGIFLHFTDASILAKSLKYLTPHYRAMLMNAELKEKAERGIL